MDQLSPLNHNISIQAAFHHQVRQYGQELISFVSAEMHRPPLGLSVTLETIEWPESLVNWVWFVGSADSATEQAVMRFFQTDVGKRALSADTTEFKFVASEFQSPPPHSQTDVPVATGGELPAAFTVAIAPLQGSQEVVIMSESASLPHSHTCISGMTGGWLLVSPTSHFSQVLLVKPRDQQAHADPRYLRGWLVDPARSMVYGRVAAIVANCGYLVTPLTGHAA
ncbi:hypothetical protein N657DRAFT_698349 [Parathielavia appendiculata]|uniref:Uncharacterized protein n=1 Tax=Parathielavia appendiculata TaxID=2587402 RepID=A0AAN6TWB8_9PEZI|nr:hypothetical protein N657DRAFT_698349 [Parathielavia appendiculata]